MTKNNEKIQKKGDKLNMLTNYRRDFSEKIFISF